MSNRNGAKRNMLLLTLLSSGILLAWGIFGFTMYIHNIPSSPLGLICWFMLIATVLAPIAVVLGIPIIILKLTHRVALANKLANFMGNIVLGIGIMCVITLAFSPPTPLEEKGRQSRCQHYQKYIALAMSMYESDNNGYLPPPERWNDALSSDYLPSEYMSICPSTRTHAHYYAMNSVRKDLRIEDIKNSESVVLIFDSQPGDNVHGRAEILPNIPRHDDGDNYAFADGHIKWVKRT